MSDSVHEYTIYSWKMSDYVHEYTIYNCKMSSHPTNGILSTNTQYTVEKCRIMSMNTQYTIVKCLILSMITQYTVVKCPHIPLMGFCSWIDNIQLNNFLTSNISIYFQFILRFFIIILYLFLLKWHINTSVAFTKLGIHTASVSMLDSTTSDMFEMTILKYVMFLLWRYQDCTFVL